MKLYPLLDTLSKVGSKEAMLGLVRAHRHQATGELAEKLQTAETLLEQSPSVGSFLVQARRQEL
jgi:hypothetical protein